MPVKCPQCGYDNAEEAAFCNLCYNVLKKSPSPPPVAGISAAPARAQAAPLNTPAAEPLSSGEDDTSDILNRIKQGWQAALFCGSFTLLVLFAAGAIPSLAKMVSPWSFIDAALLFGLAFGIRAKSRTAATLMFLYYVGDKIYLWTTTGKPTGFIVVGLFTWYFYRAMVATYDYHRAMRE